MRAQQRQKGLSIEPDPTHQSIHHEGDPGHVSRVFHETDEEKENQYLREKNDDPTHTGDHAIGDQCPQVTFRHVGCYLKSGPFKEGFNPSHGAISHFENQGEKQPENAQKDGPSPDGMQQAMIEPVTQGNPFLFVSLDRSLNDLVNQIIPGGNQLVFPARMTGVE